MVDKHTQDTVLSHQLFFPSKHVQSSRNCCMGSSKFHLWALRNTQLGICLVLWWFVGWPSNVGSSFRYLPIWTTSLLEHCVLFGYIQLLLIWIQLACQILYDNIIAACGLLYFSIVNWESLLQITFHALMSQVRVSPTMSAS